MIYKEWLNKWLELYVRPTVKMQTFDKYETIARVHIIPNLGGCAVSSLSAERLQKFVVGLTGTLSANTINGVVTVLQKSLKSAASLGVVQKQYSDKIKRPKPNEKRVECFTLAEQRKIENEIRGAGCGKLYGVLISMYTGLRIGELLALKWRDVDMVKGLIYVNKSCHWRASDEGYKQVIETPKTVQSVRVIPIPRQLMPYIRELKRESVCEFVINANSAPISTRAYQYAFERLLKKLDIPHKGFHALRHTFATRALECGMDVKTLSEILGHKNANVTLSRYAHSLIEHKKEMMNKLGRYCGLKNNAKDEE